jgi:hypothetical protein
MGNCPIHGLAPAYICSKQLLELKADGTLPEITTVEVEGNFFRVNVTPEEAAEYPTVNNLIPFNVACDIMDTLTEMCGFCFEERRKALEAQLKQCP